MKDNMEENSVFMDMEEMFDALRQGIRDTRLILQGDYLRHIEEQIDMYRLLQDFVLNTRLMAQEKELPAFSRLATQYERKADKLFLSWNIPDAYLNSGDPDDLSELMEDETYLAFDTIVNEWDDEEEDEDEDSGEDSYSAFASMSSFIHSVHQLLDIFHAMEVGQPPCPPDNR